MTSRRIFLQWASAAAVAQQTLVQPVWASSLGKAPGRAPQLGDARILVQFGPQMEMRIAGIEGRRAVWLTPLATSEFLTLADGQTLRHFGLHHHLTEKVLGVHGDGTRLTVTGRSAEGIEKTVQLTLFKQHPGFAQVQVSYRNASQQTLSIRSWTNGALQLQGPGLAPGKSMPNFWAYSGSSYQDRRDWVQQLRDGFEQQNFLGMTASDYGGGTPIVDVWRRDFGLAVGHLALEPKIVSLPVRGHSGGAHLAVEAQQKIELAPGERFDTLETFVCVHRGDYFATLDSYRLFMADLGVCAAKPPAASYSPIWCAYGYERNFSTDLVITTLPKVRELGLDWAVLDDGWQDNVGDWRVNKARFPRGTPDMLNLVAKVRENELKARLWWTPLAAAPGSDLLHDHTDMLLLDSEGAPQAISYWNSFYLCPAYDKTVEYTLALVREFLGDWGFAGLKIDGQHLNGVAPCYNRAHHHRRPEESVEKLPEFFRAIYDTAMQINPEAVVELCPCGTSYSFYNFPFINQAPASDPESSWQVRHKGKTLKALMGPSAPYAGDHVELSDHGDDFASTVGVGAVVSTKFTWPVDPKPKDSFLLTPQREVLWRKWIALYKDKMLPQGIYRGELYDIGFDEPEAHAIEKSGGMYYAFYADRWAGPISLRGLGAGDYRVRDYFNDRDFGKVTRAKNTLQADFEHFLLLEAIPA
jgi:alpha-galactosidase